jgi:hypothetical protein
MDEERGSLGVDESSFRAVLSVLAAAFSSSSEMQTVLEKAKKNWEGSGVVAFDARRALGIELNELLAPTRQSLEKDAQLVYEEVCRQRDYIEALGAKLDDLINRRFDVTTLLMPGPLKERFEEEYPREKRVIVQHLAKAYFSGDSSEPMRCFVQASTTILHLAEVLRNLSRHPDVSCRVNLKRVLFHTNSTFFAYAMLGADSNSNVYTLCGKHHDPKCCGWLFDHSDADAGNYLRQLFHRASEPLKYTFVTPQYMTLEGGLFFARPETATLVSILLEESPYVIVSSPAQRIYEGNDALRRAHRDVEWAHAAPDWTNAKQTVDVVVAGPLKHLSGDRQTLASLGRRGTCWYNSISEPVWHSVS